MPFCDRSMEEEESVSACMAGWTAEDGHFTSVRLVCDQPGREDVEALIEDRYIPNKFRRPIVIVTVMVMSTLSTICWVLDFRSASQLGSCGLVDCICLICHTSLVRQQATCNPEIYGMRLHSLIKSNKLFCDVECLGPPIGTKALSQGVWGFPVLIPLEPSHPRATFITGYVPPPPQTIRIKLSSYFLSTSHSP
ncbi:hypothetical protein SODALDRAFT_363257 [Sodiomyces alkalinus F11]|uniref:Uncharacterized protein n=1 Tax=Sodiomyces alkalinus (strain CBS 110278 / VKM F-3762 / F11) TaxID=1314773 RepID=A0A3N2PLM4_SODAK|nr:hypothetical protein SODALDRAFT_363257 [Sodiomyces alkalinus F11]ROT35431.1 hypothetical protein SODALDRAFT_363257 [Sodiomyces alkalinus F11]